MRADQRARRDAFLNKIGSRPVVMGILNLTPDSFSDGGKFQNIDTAVAHAKAMVADGCDIVDVGGESTRPGAAPVSQADELARIGPVLERLASTGVAISIDTYKTGVAAKAVELGAVLVNDVWGLQKDEGMADTVAASEAAVVIMHNRTEKDETLDILADIRRFFDRSLALAAKAGIPKDRIILDPGIGFGKTSRQNVACIARLSELKHYGQPILIGASRKAFLGSLRPEKPEATVFGTVAVALAAATNGALIFRVHDVTAHVTALRVFQTIREARPPSSWGRGIC